MFECKICNQIFENSRQLISHLKSHNIDYQSYLKTYVYKPFLYYNIQINPGTCPICGNSIKLTGFKLKKFCCHKCANEFMKSETFISEIDKKRRQTCIDLYGDENYRNSEKSKETKLKKYGDSNYNNRIQAKQTCIELYGVENPFQSDLVKQKIKKTNLKKYGFESHNQNELVKNKVKESILKKFGTEVYTQSDDYKKNKKIYLEKKKQTCIDLYGVDNPCKNLAVKAKMIATNNERYGADFASQTNIVKEKAIQTNLKKYGADFYSQSETYKETLPEILNKTKDTNLKKYGADFYSQSETYKETLPEIQKKIYRIKKKNNSFNTSKPEIKLLKILQTKFGTSDIEYQYRSDLYPFACDFYIKSLDLYIELQGSWTHGSEPYNPDSKDHQQKLNEWQQKAQTSQFYRNAIDVWTVRDPLKRKIAIQNKLNYIEVFDSEFFSEIEFLLN